MEVGTDARSETAAIEITPPASVSLLPTVMLLLLAGVSFALARMSLATRAPKHDLAVMSLRIAITKLMTASKRFAVVLHEVATRIAGGMPRGWSAAIPNAKFITCIVSFAIAWLRHSAGLLSLRTAGVSPAIANMRLSASARPHWLRTRGLTISIPSFAVAATSGASPLTRALRRGLAHGGGGLGAEPSINPSGPAAPAQPPRNASPPGPDAIDPTVRTFPMR